jgi:hypothetical protein
MNGGRTLLDVQAIEAFKSNLTSKKEQITAEYNNMKKAADELGSVAFKGDIVTKINEAMQIIDEDRTQIENVVTRFTDFLEDVKNKTIERDREAAASIAQSSENIREIKKG